MLVAARNLASSVARLVKLGLIVLHIAVAKNRKFALNFCGNQVEGAPIALLPFSENGPAYVIADLEHMMRRRRVKVDMVRHMGVRVASRAQGTEKCCLVASKGERRSEDLNVTCETRACDDCVNKACEYCSVEFRWRVKHWIRPVLMHNNTVRLKI